MRWLAALLMIAACSSKTTGRKVRIAAASDLALAFAELGKEFEKQTGITPLFDFGSSGLYAKQIEQGAPYFLFAAADRNYAEQVVKAGKCDGATLQQYGRGRIVVWTPAKTVAPMKLEDLAEPRFTRIAIANPDHAPYGRAAKQALQKVGVWDKVQARIIPAESVQAAMRVAHANEVDAAIVALSLAVVTDGGASLTVDQALYDPLEQSLVVCGAGEESDRARQFAAFIGSPEGREVMTRYGFLLPSEQTPPKHAP